jgi:hypothetical protein
MDLREYVVALSVVCRPSQTLDTIQLAFQASGMYVHMVHGDSEMWSHQSSGGFRGLCQICRAVNCLTAHLHRLVPAVVCKLPQKLTNPSPPALVIPTCLRSME